MHFLGCGDCKVSDVEARGVRYDVWCCWACTVELELCSDLGGTNGLLTCRVHRRRKTASSTSTSRRRTERVSVLAGRKGGGNTLEVRVSVRAEVRTAWSF